MADKYVTAEEVADKYSISVHGIRGWRRRGIVPTHLYLKIGGQYRYDLAGLEKFFRNNTAQSKSEEVKEDTRTPRQKLDDYSLTGKSEELKAQLTEMDFAADEDF